MFFSEFNFVLVLLERWKIVIVSIALCLHCTKFRFLIAVVYERSLTVAIIEVFSLLACSVSKLLINAVLRLILCCFHWLYPFISSFRGSADLAVWYLILSLVLILSLSYIAVWWQDGRYICVAGYCGAGRNQQPRTHCVTDSWRSHGNCRDVPRKTAAGWCICNGERWFQSIFLTISQSIMVIVRF